MKMMFSEIYFDCKQTGEYEGNEYMHLLFLDRDSGENKPLKFSAGNEEVKKLQIPAMVPLSGEIVCEVKGGGKYPTRYVNGS